MTSVRPNVHFTAERGWLNDPHGICWVDGTYHLFYQHHPGRVWAPDVEWGHATGPDLVGWGHRPVALTPHDGEGGCWTGTTVVVDGDPLIFYTSVPTESMNDGRVAVARADAGLTRWTSSAADVVVQGAPAELGAYAFRDPCIVRYGDSWRMVVGVGVHGGIGLAVQYISDDLASWTYDGVISSRSTADQGGVWTGGLWECPQLFRVGGSDEGPWVLAVSVWDADVLYYVAAALGTYDGHTFVAESWRRLTHDETAYAMTSFADRDGRPCVMFWLREDADHDPESRPWVGALSVPMVVSVGADRTIELQPHPDLAALRGRVVTDGPLDGTVHLEPEGGALDIEICGGGVTLDVEDGTAGPVARIEFSRGEARVERPDRPPLVVPTVADTVRVVVDAGILEIFGGDGVAAFRFAGEGPFTVIVRGEAERLTVHRLGGSTPLQ